MNIKIGVSNHHVHLKKEDLENLFGSNYELQPQKELSQPGEFASQEKITLKTEKGTIENVRILGPIRSYTQVEISKTDAFKLGLNPPVRESGDLSGSEAITLVGPKGEVSINEGCIIASRHIHITHADRVKMNLLDVDKVSVRINGIKGGIMENVTLKESDNYVLEMHIDTDDANAHLINQGDIGEIIK